MKRMTTLEEYAEEIRQNAEIIARTSSPCLRRDRQKYQARLVERMNNLIRRGAGKAGK